MEVGGADRSTAGRACIPQHSSSVFDRMERRCSCTEQLKNLGSRLRVIGRRRLHARSVLNPPLTRVATWVCCAGPAAASHCLCLPSFLRLGFARL
jgi:hypothetical protein